MKKNHLFHSLFYVCLLTILFSSCGQQKVSKSTTFSELKHPKREFRGAWIHTVGQGQYKNMNSTQMKEYFLTTLNQLKAVGINAVVFQVRPQADSFYKSDLEPWSIYLTGTQGKAMDGGFDPLAFLVEECHKRNMELHAWMNPYRVTSNESQENLMTSNHIYKRHPERFVKYGKQLYFDPGIPVNRDFICQVVKDIVSRYEVDAIHMDDYFYPYPIAGIDFPDNNSFNTYAKSQGFEANQRGDWRRNNVNMLIKEIRQTISSVKPWVRFGVSPFGIYRNKKSTPDGSGSETNGLQNYDDLFADIKLWAEKGWIDYNLPQLYWEIGHKAADYGTLIEWWAKNSWGQHLYIGQAVRRTMDATMPSGDSQLAEKMRTSRAYPATVHGNCFWPGYDLMNNYKGISDELVSNYHKYPALIPAYTNMHARAPKPVKSLKESYSATQHILTWKRNGDAKDPESAQYFVIYRFANNEAIDLNKAENMLGTTRETEYVLPYENGSKKYKYVVTAVDAFHNESKGKIKKITL